MKGVLRQRAAEKDLKAIFRYYSREVGLSVARRFSIQENAAFKHLAEMPNMGAVYDASNKHLTGLRFFPITGFEKYLVFYRPANNGIEIIRILHSARNVEEILKPTN